MITETETRPTWAEINLNHLNYNFKSAKQFIGQDIQYMAVVKADAYGHGSLPCAKSLEAAGVDWFGVALPEEGYELRKNGIRAPILCLGGFWFGQESALLENKITPVIYQFEKAERLNQTANELGTTVNIHIKIDTGMGRIGVRFDEVKDFARQLTTLPNLRVEGLMTHFATADDLSQNDYTYRQINRFDESVKIFESFGFKPVYKDLANSPGAVVHPESRKNLVRLGGILYGLGDDVLPKNAPRPDLKPVLSLHSKIALLKRVPAGESLGYSRTFTTQRDSLIATIPIGYADGLSRSLSNCGNVLINGRYAPIVGRVSMDWTIVDVTDIQEVKVNDEVIFIGQQNNLKITAEDLAIQTKTISYEVTCGISERVIKKYVES